MSLLLPSYADPLSLLADRLDPPDRDVFALLGYEPTERQAEFHQATEFDVLYGGAAGGGKTKALLMEALRACDRHPGLVVACFRRTYGELDESLIYELSLVGFAEVLGARWNASKRDLKFPNGSLIRFRYAENVQDATRRQGSEIQLLIVDERTQVDARVVDYLATRLRSGRSDVPVLGIRSGTNPGGFGHGSVKARFVTGTDHGKRIYCDKRNRTVRFIPAKVTDNPHINPEYIADLDGMEDAALRAALRDGSWDSFAGQFFAEWRHDRHVVRPFKIPDDWQRRAAIDWGYAKPWAVGWGARDNDGRVWLYRELYDIEVGERDQARRILAAEKGQRSKLKGRHADPSMWNRRGEVHSIADMYAAEGCHLLKAENDRTSGWQRVHSYLDDGPLCDVHRNDPAWLEDSCPMLHVFDTCSNVVRTMPDQVHDLTDVEDLDTEGEDHAADMVRYLLMAFGLRPPKQPKPLPSDEPGARLDRYIEARRKTAKKQRSRTVGS